jgi:hypothetical protein
MNETFIPKDLSDKVLYLIKKILVYSSKIEFLQKKIFRQNENFNINQIFKEIDKYSKGYLTLDDMSFFFHSFGFDLNDWEVFKVMSYASKYKLATLEELNVREEIDNERMKDMTKKWFDVESADQKIPRSDLVYDKPIYYLDQKDFESLIKPFDFGFVQRGNVSGHSLRKQDYHMIKQIILLTLKKLDDMSRAVKMLQDHSAKEIYEFLCQFNNSELQDKNKLDFPILNHDILSNHNFGIKY